MVRTDSESHPDALIGGAATQDLSLLREQRQSKLAAWRKTGSAYPNHFRRDHLAADVVARYDKVSAEELNQQAVSVKMAGRMMTWRLMGKVSFVNLQDDSGQIQLYIRQDEVTPVSYDEFKTWDLGDIIGVVGELFRTKTGELSVKVRELTLLTKSLRPLPDKYHGLANRELCYRQRYLDLLTNANTRRVFHVRAQLIAGIRTFLTERHFLEVETPMMHPLSGGALARPFVTHHHALDRLLYLRVAPELYLKRLIVGGLERVFEINRNFRNEGLSTQHNPEFTMVEFYQAYADYRDLMALTEALLRYLSQILLQREQVIYQAVTIDFSQPFVRLSMLAAILAHYPALQPQDLHTLTAARRTAEQLQVLVQPEDSVGKIQAEIFEKTVEHRLVQPTFITDYPVEVSPLARCHDDQPDLTERFELFIAGREIANGFSELNDPEDQRERFQQQMQHKAAGDAEAMPYDEDYLVALEYGLPPTAGEGIGIDRLAMLFADVTSIRDVILFPQLRDKT